MVFELNALFHEPQALVQELCLLHCHQGESKGFIQGRKEGRKGRRNSSGQTQRERERERERALEREKRTIMGFASVMKNLSWRFAFFQH
jgi:hypothetical protein